MIDFMGGDPNDLVSVTDAIVAERDRLQSLCEELKGALDGIYNEIAGINAEDRTKAESNIGYLYT
jgi:hypothetical protein